jgi:benzoyl-CoA reductase subunit C
MEVSKRIGEICDEFESACSIPFNESLQAYKQGGGRIVGVLYDQVPEEIVMAAGALPVRLRAVGSTGTERSAARFTQVNCSFVHHMYDSAAKGRFDFIDGLVASNACDHVRKLFENWVSELKPGFSHMICFPKRKGDDLQVSHLADELRKLAQALEEGLGTEVSDDKLREAIESANARRKLQMRLYELRCREVPPITGTQALAVNMAATCMPRDEYDVLLSELVSESEHATSIEDPQEYRARVILYGGELDSLDFLRAVESQGALVVGDSLGGFGRRSVDFQVPVDGDPIDVLAKYYLQVRPPEPRLHGTRVERWDYLESAACEAHADGIIQVHIPLCDLWSYERIMFDVEVENKGLHCLDLDTEYIFDNAGQTRTRVQAFVEQLEDEEGGR